MIDAIRLFEILAMHKAMSEDQVKRLFWTAGSRRAGRALQKIMDERGDLMVARDYTPHGFPAVMYMLRDFCINPPMAKKLVMANELWFRYWERYGWGIKFAGFLYRDVTAYIKDLNGVIHHVIVVLNGERLPRIPVEAEQVVYIAEKPINRQNTNRVRYLTWDQVKAGVVENG